MQLIINKEGVNLRQPDKRKEGILGAICDHPPTCPPYVWRKNGQNHKKCTKIENVTPNLVKTNEVVWDAIRIAMDPEKKLRIAEIEIYR